MTAVQQAQTYGGGIGYACNVGNGGGGNFAYHNGTLGSLTPNTYKGQLISSLESQPGIEDFAVSIQTNGLPQTFFTRVEVQDSAGVIRSYLSSAAAYFPNPGVTVWTWGGGASLVWTAAGLRSVRFLP